MAPDYFADHIGNLTVELVLATVEISTLIVHTPPTLEALLVLQESEAFPGHEPEGKEGTYQGPRGGWLQHACMSEIPQKSFLKSITAAFCAAKCSF